MFTINRVILFFALFALSIGLMACGGGATTDNKPANNTTTNKPAENKPADNKPAENKPAENKPADNKTSEANKPADGKETAGGDKIGVPECDTYIAKYEACIMDKMPEAQRGAFKSTLEQSRKAWKEAAANPTTKAGLSAACKTALDAAKASTTALGCKWD